MSMKHHAVCYVGERRAREELTHYFEAHDPDVHVLTYDEFGIADARELGRRSSQTPLAAAEQVFLVSCGGLTHEAQNALLKLFEEPAPKTQFYLIVPKRGLLLPTLQSRLMIVEEREMSELENRNESYDAFKKATYGERLELIAELCKAHDTVEIETLLEGAEHELVNQAKDGDLLKTVLIIRDYISRRGASKKMLLESLALSLPRR